MKGRKRVGLHGGKSGHGLVGAETVEGQPRTYVRSYYGEMDFKFQSEEDKGGKGEKICGAKQKQQKWAISRKINFRAFEGRTVFVRPSVGGWGRYE